MAKPCFLSQLKEFPFSQDEVADIWRLARENYIDKGTSFEATIAGLARDLGMRQEHIAQAFTMPKVVRHISNDMWAKMQVRRDAVRQAKGVVEGLNSPELLRKIDQAYNAPRSALLFGHGGVFPMTHMGQMIFQPSRWGVFFRASTRAWSYIGQKGSKRYEIAIQRHLSDPDYMAARRASGSVDPAQETVGLLNNMKGWSARGFNTLKLARLELFKQQWHKLPLEERTPENAKPIMNVIDAATGEVSLGQAGKYMAKAFLAPKLMPARFKMAVVDPARAVTTFANWKNATAGERSAARFAMRNLTESVAFYHATLAANLGLNIAFGADKKDRVNITDPSRGDWLSFKFGGLSVRPPNGFIELLRLAGGMTTAYLTPEKKLRGAHPEQRAAARLSDYLRYKFHPTLRVTGEIASGKDLFGRPLPFRGIRQHLLGEAAKPTEAKPQIEWPEYLIGKGPIPFGGGAREFYDMLREEGINHQDAMAWIKAASVTALEAEGISAHETHESKTANQPSDLRREMMRRDLLRNR